MTLGTERPILGECRHYLKHYKQLFLGIFVTELTSGLRIKPQFQTSHINPPSPKPKTQRSQRLTQKTRVLIRTSQNLRYAGLVLLSGSIKCALI